MVDIINIHSYCKMQKAWIIDPLKVYRENIGKSFPNQFCQYISTTIANDFPKVSPLKFQFSPWSPHCIPLKFLVARRPRHLWGSLVSRGKKNAMLWIRSVISKLQQKQDNIFSVPIYIYMDKYGNCIRRANVTLFWSIWKHSCSLLWTCFFCEIHATSFTSRFIHRRSPTQTPQLYHTKIRVSKVKLSRCEIVLQPHFGYVQSAYI